MPPPRKPGILRSYHPGVCWDAPDGERLLRCYRTCKRWFMDRTGAFAPDGALLVAVRDGTQRIDDQDWSELTLEGWPASEAVTEQREVFEQDFSEHGDDVSTVVRLSTDGAGKVHIDVSESPEPRAWLVRLHLAPGQALALDAAAEDVGSVRHLEPRSDCDDAGFFPFAGAGSAARVSQLLSRAHVGLSAVPRRRR